MTPLLVMLFLGISLFITQPTHGAMGFRPVLAISRGTGPGQVQWLVEDGVVPDGMLMGPTAFLLDGQTRLHLGDTLNHRILVFQGKTLERTIPLLPGPDCPHKPLLIALIMTSDGGYIVGDAANNRLLRVYPSGKVIAFGGNDKNLGDFIQIDRVQVDGTGRIYVEDASRQQTVVFTPDGKYLTTYPGETGVFIDNDGTFIYFLFRGDVNRREIHRRNPETGKDLVLGTLDAGRPISFVNVLGRNNGFS